jgi:type III pantothenate kinase
MNLVIDIGNTLTKIAVFSSSDLLHSKSFRTNDPFDLDGLLSEFPHIKNCILSNVSENDKNILSSLTNKKIAVIRLDENTSLPFINKYKTPSTLGKDRIAAIAGAYKLYPGKNVLVIDAGTAIKYELKNSKEEYLGGNISPGLDMRFKALNQFTARLPLVRAEENFSLIGESTIEAIINGVQNGLIFEIQGYIEKLEKIYPELIIIGTGGNAQFFDNLPKKTIFVVSNLTLIGLNTILEYNVQTN